MRTVPRQEILHPVDTGNNNMERILGRLRWQRLPGDKCRSECNHRIRHVQKGETFKHGEASLSGLWIARPGLGQHHLGGEKLVACPLLVSPRHGELLMSGYEQITAWPCRKITDDARFDIDGGFRAACVCGFHGPEPLEESGCVWVMIPDCSSDVWTILGQGCCIARPDPMFQDCAQDLMVDALKALSHVALDVPLGPGPRLLHGRERRVTAAARSEAMGVVAQLWLVIRLEKGAYNLL